MSSAEPDKSTQKNVSATRMLILLVPLLVVVAVVAYIYGTQVDPTKTSSNRNIEEVVMSSLGLDNPTQNRLAAGFVDSDGDLVADPPDDETEWLDPETLLFSYVASSDNEGEEERWAPFVEFLSEQTGKPVEYVRLGSIDEQLKALEERRLHVTGFNTGAVPLAVNAHGFVPVCTYGDDDGNFGYRMEIVVAADSPIEQIEDLQGEEKEVAFTHMSSNSGFRAPMILLLNDYGLSPERDYTWAFSGSHNASIQGLANGRYEIAAVASDMLDRAEADGEVDSDKVRTIYRSERFPPAALGYVYELKPEIAEKVRAAFSDFSFSETPLAEEFASVGGTRFVPVSYKDDWALIRRIQDATGAPPSSE